MKVAKKDLDSGFTATRDVEKGLRGLVFAMLVSVAMWAGMLGAAQSLLG